MMYEKKAGKALGGYVRSEIVPRRNYNSEKLEISLCYQPSIQAQISILSSKEKNFLHQLMPVVCRSGGGGGRRGRSDVGGVLKGYG